MERSAERTKAVDEGSKRRSRKGSRRSKRVQKSAYARLSPDLSDCCRTLSDPRGHMCG